MIRCGYKITKVIAMNPEKRSEIHETMKNLTTRYALTQFTHWAAATGAVSFATTYLLDKGIPSGTIGTLLAAGGMLSCLIQPWLASLADRAKGSALTPMLSGLCTLCGLCYGLQLIPGLPLPLICLCYLLGLSASDTISPLLNALCVACQEDGYALNYGVSRSAGSVSSAAATLVLGYIIAKWGMVWMLVFLAGIRLLCILSLSSYPKLRQSYTAATKTSDSYSVFTFIGHYRWFCLSLVGIGFMGMYLAMTENFLIAIVGRLGGDSGHVGTALFISSLSGAPAVFFFSWIHKRLSNSQLLKIAAISFLLRAVLFSVAPSITAIYRIQILQATSYGFLAPTQVFYARSKVRPADMVKGQTFVTASYALGCSIGNFTGGQLLNLGVDALLLAGVVMAALGASILFSTINRSDSPSSEAVITAD